MTLTLPKAKDLRWPGARRLVLRIVLLIGDVQINEA